jgi:hypothetical protein
MAPWTIFGAGPLGTGVARIAVERGLPVRIVTSSGHNPLLGMPGVESRAADAMDLAHAIEAAEGARVVFHCANRPYQRWKDELPRMNAGILAAARAAGARLVVADNLYMYAQEPQPITEANPVQPPTRKGRIRAALAAEMLEAHAAGEVEVVLARASDFFGPHAENAQLSVSELKALLAGRPVRAMGDIDAPHSWAYAPDFSRALATLAEAPADAMGRAWIIPHAPALSWRAMVTRAAGIGGVMPRFRPIPGWAVRAAGLFSPFLAEIAEMQVQFDRPFTCSGADYEARFGQAATPTDAALAATIAWVRANL